MLRLRTLGTIDLQREDGEELRAVLAQPKRIGLLAFLALSSPIGWQRRDRLIALFWPELDTERARNALNQAIFFLRRHLGSEAILTRNAEEVAVATDILWCDATAFAVHVELAATHITMNPVAVNMQCHSARRSRATFTPAGVEYGF